MRVVQVVRDDTMPAPGYEHHTLECPGCHEVERRLQFAREPTVLASESVQDQSVAAPAVVAASSTVAQSTVAQSTVAQSTVAQSTVAQSNWARAIDRLRSQQSYLQERQAEAKAAEAIGRFRDDWEGLAHRRRQSDAIVAPPVPAAPPPATISKVAKPFSVSKFSNASKTAGVSKPADVSRSFRGSTIPAQSIKAAVRDARAPLRTAPSSVMARAIAKLPRQAAVMKPIDRNSEDSKRFDELWESFAPTPQRAAPAPSSRPASAPSSRPASDARSLVPVKEIEASSAWARAMLMLRASR